MFALVLTPAKTLEDLKPVQAEHEQYLQKYDASGTFILRGGLLSKYHDSLAPLLSPSV